MTMSPYEDEHKRGLIRHLWAVFVCVLTVGRRMAELKSEWALLKGATGINAVSLGWYLHPVPWMKMKNKKKGRDDGNWIGNTKKHLLII